jgi:hypothetical protein
MATGAEDACRPIAAVQVCPLTGILIPWSVALGTIAAALGWRGAFEVRLDGTILAAPILAATLGSLGLLERANQRIR